MDSTLRATGILLLNITVSLFAGCRKESDAFHIALGDSNARVGDFDGARADYDRAIEFAPKPAEALPPGCD